ncbi:gluconate 2-dehydrogenase subunit 3 family protein, partial [Phenylobacterium sp.]|uniref:gluconate 2-dehydrogenase subunit 3 family protein n=1 Tax=Phenylobacterium sp. TaxID=1871053 RepID=UPI00286ACC5B
ASSSIGAGLSRREFVAGLTALGAVWLAACSSAADQSAKATDSTPAIPMDAPAPPQRLVHFTPEQAAEIEAMTVRLIPSDDGPGAKEAGAVFFIDNSLAGLVKEQAPLFAAGLQTVAKSVTAKHGATAKFSTLTPAQQDAILTGIEKSEFFGALRFATIAGFLSLPKYGGNKDYVGWQYIGQQHAFEQKAPFGWYDEPANQQALLGRVL